MEPVLLARCQRPLQRHQQKSRPNPAGRGRGRRLVQHRPGKQLFSLVLSVNDLWSV